jgi:hypothetical protein
VTHRGEHFVVEDARVFDLPRQRIRTYVAAGGTRAAELAADIADGVCATEPDERIVSAYLGAGGDPTATWGQVVLAWAEDEQTGLADAHAQFRFAAGAGTQTITPEELGGAIPAGPDVERHAAAVREFADAGFEHIELAYPGSDADGFMRFWRDGLRDIV